VSGGKPYPRRVSSPTLFEEALARHGFREVQDRRDVQYYSASPSSYLTYSVHVLPDGTALFTWEFAIGEYLSTLGLQVGSDEHLNTFLFPREDARGPQEPAWLAAQVERTEAVLRSISFLAGTPIDEEL
jgi:hypothetical protein